MFKHSKCNDSDNINLKDSSIFYAHGSGNSLDMDQDDFFDYIENKDSGIIVSANLLLEGYNDPKVDCVFMTYGSTSIIKKMQAVGRSVRSYPGKKHCYVIEAANEGMSYYFEQRFWPQRDKVYSSSLKFISLGFLFSCSLSFVFQSIIHKLCKYHLL